MTYPILIILLAIVLLAVIALISQKSGASTSIKPEPHYTALPGLLSPAERSFFGVLGQALGQDYQLFTKVRLADLIKPENNPNRSQWQSAFNRIAGKHVDFVVCHPEDMSVKAVIELDDSSHAKADRKRRDDFVDIALKSAAIPILHIPASQSYQPSQLRNLLENAIQEGAHSREPTTR